MPSVLLQSIVFIYASYASMLQIQGQFGPDINGIGYVDQGR